MTLIVIVGATALVTGLTIGTVIALFLFDFFMDPETIDGRQHRRRIKRKKTRA